MPAHPSAATLRLGATKPPRLPIALMTAMPPAAAAPPKYPIGKVQKIGWALISPATETQSATTATSGGR